MARARVCHRALVCQSYTVMLLRCAAKCNLLQYERSLRAAVDRQHRMRQHDDVLDARLRARLVWRERVCASVLVLCIPPKPAEGCATGNDRSAAVASSTAEQAFAGQERQGRQEEGERERAHDHSKSRCKTLRPHASVMPATLLFADQLSSTACRQQGYYRSEPRHAVQIQSIGWQKRRAFTQ